MLTLHLFGFPSPLQLRTSQLAEMIAEASKWQRGLQPPMTPGAPAPPGTPGLPGAPKLPGTPEAVPPGAAPQGQNLPRAPAPPSDAKPRAGMPPGAIPGRGFPPSALDLLSRSVSASTSADSVARVPGIGSGFAFPPPAFSAPPLTGFPPPGAAFPDAGFPYGFPASNSAAFARAVFFDGSNTHRFGATVTPGMDTVLPVSVTGGEI